LISGEAPRRIMAMRHPQESHATEDALLLAVVGMLLFFVMASLEVFGHLAAWLHGQELIDDLVSFALVAVAGFAIFSWRRWRELQAAQRELRILSGVIPICAWCRRARTETGGWMPLEDYVRRESEADLSPDLCPDCERRIPAPGARRGFF
jgi:hypothetical protein